MIEFLPIYVPKPRLSTARLPKVKPFWIVWTPDFPATPTIKHATKDLAIRAADALANKYPDRDYFVLEPRTCSRYSTDHAKPFSRRGVYCG